MKINEISNIGSKIRKERRTRGFSQSELSKNNLFPVIKNLSLPDEYVFTNGGRDFVSLSLSLSLLLLLLLPPREISERRENDRFSSHGELLSLDARARSVALKKNIQSIKSSLPLLRFFPKRERERATLSSSCVRGERTFGERNPKKEKQNLLSILLP